MRNFFTFQCHRFPLNSKILLSKWLVAVRRENFKANGSTRICSDHFLGSDYKVRPGASSKYLKDDAVPSLFDFPEHLKVSCFN